MRTIESPEDAYYSRIDKEGEPVFLDDKLQKPWLCDTHKDHQLALDWELYPECTKCSGF